MSDPINRAFLKKIYPDCLAVSLATGVHPLVIAGDACYETGFGEDSTILHTGADNNYFGLKSRVGASLPNSIGEAYCPTSEFEEGTRVPVKDWFGKYPNFKASAMDFAGWVSGKTGLDKYKDMPLGDINAMAEELEKRGYSTEARDEDDPHGLSSGYAFELRNMIERIRTQAPDIIGNVPAPKPIVTSDKEALRTLRDVMEFMEKDPRFVKGTDLHNEVMTPIRRVRDYHKNEQKEA